MDHADKLRRFRFVSATAFKEFLHDESSYILHIFVEGHTDPSFYRNFFKDYVSEFGTPRFYKCGDKCQVYATRKKIIGRENTEQNEATIAVLYFVDKDLSDFGCEEYAEAPDVFVTEHYSIENYLVCDEILRVIWADIIHFYGEKTPAIDQFLQSFHHELRRFYRLVQPVMVWGIHHKRRGNTVRLEDIRMTELFEFDMNDDDLVLKQKIASTSGKLIAKLDEMCNTSTTDLDTDEEEIAVLLSKAEPKRFVRGKFETWFMCTYIKEYLRMLKQVYDEFKYPQGFLKNDDIVKALGPRLSITPTDIANFLNRNLASLSADP